MLRVGWVVVGPVIGVSLRKICQKYGPVGAKDDVIERTQEKTPNFCYNCQLLLFPAYWQ